MTSPRLLWTPDPTFQAESHLVQYQNWLAENYHLHFSNYDQLWQWSVDHTKAFWQSIVEYFQVNFHQPYSAVHSDDPMPDTSWFPGATVSYAEHIFRQSNEKHPALLFQSETQPLTPMSWTELREHVAAFQSYLTSIGVGEGDRVVAFIPNIPEATVAFLAVNGLGAVWSSCSPDFGSASIIDRFQQIKPKVLITVDGYRYGGKAFDKQHVVREVVAKLTALEKVVTIPYLNEESGAFIDGADTWQEAIDRQADLVLRPVPFDHPIWILYSSGTTGQPKAITHSTGGVLLEHLKYVSFHNDVKPGERFFWYTTTGWMMWNYLHATMLAGATLVLVDGSPSYPDMGILWKLVEEAQIHHFGTSAPYILACMKKKADPQAFNLTSLRSISSTGAPLPPEGFDWIYGHVKNDIWLVSMSGGTDVCSAFVGGCPTEPIYEGEIQRRALGCGILSFDDQGQSLTDEVGEMVITKPMPSMPIYFWGDPNKVRYKDSYFDMFSGVWRHGDWLRVTDRNTIIILGRSDATLNRDGIRIGTAEIYSVVDTIDTIKDSLIVNIEKRDGSHFMPLFVVMNTGAELSPDVINEIRFNLKKQYTPRHVPDEVIEVPDIPYTISGKKMEAPVKKILMGVEKGKAANEGVMRNPEALGYFTQL